MDFSHQTVNKVDAHREACLRKWRGVLLGIFDIVDTSPTEWDRSDRLACGADYCDWGGASPATPNCSRRILSCNCSRVASSTCTRDCSVQMLVRLVLARTLR